MKFWKIKAIKAGTIKTTIGDTIRYKSLDVPLEINSWFVAADAGEHKLKRGVMNRRNFIKTSGILMILSDLINRASGNEILDKQNGETQKFDKEIKMKHKCKITVLKRECYTDLQEQYLANPKQVNANFLKTGRNLSLITMIFSE